MFKQNGPNKANLKLVCGEPHFCTLENLILTNDKNKEWSIIITNENNPYFIFTKLNINGENK